MLSRAARPVGRVASRGARTAIRRSAAPAVVVGRTLTTNAKAADGSARLAAYGVVGATLVAGAIVNETHMAGTDWAAVRAEIVKIMEDEDGNAKVSDPHAGPVFVRLAWHCSGTYCKETDTGGSDGGTMRFNPEAGHGANAGLGIARKMLEPVKAKFPDVSYADLYIFAGKVAIEEMSGSEIVIPFNPGRTDAADGKACTPDGRLPDADKGKPESTIQHIRDIFYRMGFNDQEIVALCGAHALGRCHTDRSGYVNPWTNAETTFSNEYFRLLCEEKWTLKKWDGPEQYEDKSGNLMMLPSDMALVWDPEFNKHVQVYAKDETKFFQDFAAAYQKLNELGCKSLQYGPPKYYLFGARTNAVEKM